MGIIDLLMNNLKQQSDESELEVNQPIGKKQISEALATLKKYKDGKNALEQRIINNEEWWRLRHWGQINNGKTGRTISHKVIDENGNVKIEEKQVKRIQPVSAWLFNMISNKHADIMDNFPTTNILPREKNDDSSAKALSSIIPVVMERCRFEDTFSDNTWDKVKNGLAAYGVFWDSTAENGLGDITIQSIDILNIFWQPGITKLEQSENLFVIALKDNDRIIEEYPQLKDKIGGNSFNVKEYFLDDSVDNSEKTVVIDWYYRKNNNGKTVLHYCKFACDEVLYSSENEGLINGFYEHGRYPIILDTLFPVKGSPAGFGYIDIAKDPQMYIDKLNQIILENATLSGRARWFVKQSANINKEEYADWTKDFVSVSTGSLDDTSIKQISVNPLPSYIINHLEHKINELKETSANRDFNQGGSVGGVTAASAIAALQEAGNKQSRDIIKSTYRAYREIVYLVIELIRQFYDETREFRIIGSNGKPEFVSFSNKEIGIQQVPMSTGELSERVPIFDIEVRAERSNPFSKAANNDFAKELYGMGFFNPEQAQMALGALELMDFDGKQKVVDRVTEGQTLINMVQQQAQQLQQMSFLLAQYTGVPAVGKTMSNEQPMEQNISKSAAAKLNDGDATRHGYQERLSDRT